MITEQHPMKCHPIDTNAHQVPEALIHIPYFALARVDRTVVGQTNINRIQQTDFLPES